MGALVHCLIWIILNLRFSVFSTNYDNFIAQLATESQNLHDEFLRSNPRGQYVLNRLSSPEYLKRHPVFGESTDDEYIIRPRAWRSFLQELERARIEASRPLDDEEKLEAPQLRWYKPEHSGFYEENPSLGELELAPRKEEVAYQNHQWGEHKVSGGSGEIGQWLDFALTGAQLQDIDEEDQSGHDEDNSIDKLLKNLPAPEYKNSNLPAYCDPPNPCPIGYDPESLATPCDPHIVSTKEFNQDWILNKQTNGECSCDKEHMFSCPSGFQGSRPNPSKLYLPDEDAPAYADNPYMKGSRRKRLVAKKAFSSKKLSPRYYWQGQITKRVVKKAGSRIV